ncbi:hypothetical protein [Escherichia coli]|uniref:hypothetical protein n=1 Tax=Escherichia coli TaxID=562 RepID=UPI001E647F66|nr:hypothetical protein [Escherichia coli]MCJ7954311.1 hypothetical protein [Escherichia coli]MCL4020665.1 hypothetical protein [Escherichia coli]MDL7498934.1 hypothetical protein [Escherichia coli]MDP4339834.1 hypothetical protein [Escherichia coli]MDP4400207.1 hypothetical protein [Escherichia coli]
MNKRQYGAPLTLTDKGKTGVLIIAELFLKAVVVHQPVTCGQATGITGGIRLSDWYYKYIRELKHMSSYM